MACTKNKVVVVGASGENFLNKVAGTEGAVLDKIHDGILKYNWEINNKYYTAKIEFWLLPKNYLTSSPERLSSLSSVCGAVVFVVGEQAQSGEELSEWASFIEEYSPNVLLCVCMESTTTSKDRWRTQCKEIGVEFVELNPDQDTEEEGEAEKFGIARVLEALESNPWENLVLKDKPSNRTEANQNSPPSAMLAAGLASGKILDELGFGDDELGDFQAASNSEGFSQIDGNARATEMAKKSGNAH